MKIMFLTTILIGIIVSFGNAQTMKVNPDGTHTLIINNGKTSTQVNPDGTHTLIINNDSTLVQTKTYITFDSVHNTKDTYTMTNQDKLIYRFEAINNHRQIFPNSCIPSGIEMILKLNKKVDFDFYNYQKMWGDKTDGSFANYDSLLINGIRFYYNLKI